MTQNQRINQNETILVVGGNGTVGSGIVKQLKELGYKVKSTTSKKSLSENQDYVFVNLATGEGIKKAFEGIDKAFLLSPPGFADQYKILSPLIQESKRKGLKKVVLMTAFGANAVETSPFRRAEIELENSGLDYNILRPNWFMQNFNTFWIQGILELNKILVPAGNAKVSFIDVRDISEVAVNLLTQNIFPKQAFDLTGPQAIVHQKVAEEISKATLKSVVYQDIAPEELGVLLKKGGVPSDYVDFLLLILGYLREGYNSSVNDNVKKLLSKEPRTIADYVKSYKSFFNLK